MDSDFAVGDLKDIRGAVGDCKSMICRPSPRAAESYESGRSYHRPKFLSNDQVDTAAPRKYAAGVDERKEREDREISVGERMRGGGMKNEKGKDLNGGRGREKGRNGERGEGGLWRRNKKGGEGKKERNRREGGWGRGRKHKLPK